MLLVIISLASVGYFHGLLEDSHFPLTFSWKALWEYFSKISFPGKVSNCLFTLSENESTLAPLQFGPKPQQPETVPLLSADKHLCIFKGPSAANCLLKLLILLNGLSIFSITASALFYASLSLRQMLVGKIVRYLNHVHYLTS